MATATTSTTTPEPSTDASTAFSVYESVTLHHVDWETYRRLRDEPRHDRLRMTYLDGDLTIMSPLIRHDWNSRQMFILVTTVAGVWEIDFRAIGATTLRRPGQERQKGSAKESDEGFYLGADEARIRHNNDLDLSVDPPPSLAIEVDNLADSERALPTYARLGVPEVWIYKAGEHSLWFGRLTGEGYVEIDRSMGLPRLTPSLVLQALDARQNLGNRLWVRWLEQWARALPEPPAHP